MTDEEKNDYSDILFEYYTAPWHIWNGDEGFSINVYTDGRLVYRTYRFRRYRIVESVTEYTLLKETVAAIKAIMEEYQTEIDAFENGLDDEIYGVFRVSHFIYNGKLMVIYNLLLKSFNISFDIDSPDEPEKVKINEIEKHRLEEIKKYYPSFYESLLEEERRANARKQIRKQERNILLIFFKVSKVLVDDSDNWKPSKKVTFRRDINEIID